MPTVGTTSKPAYIYDAGTDTWVPVGVGAHTHDTSALVSVSNHFAAGKNKIINGDFAINQRAFTSTTATFGYNFDRWTFARTGGSCTISAQTFTIGTAPVAGYESKNFVRCDVSGQSAANDRFLYAQPIESVRTFANQTITVSFWAKASSGTPSVAVTVNQDFGTGGSGGVQTGGGKVAITTSWARYSVTFAVPSISGKTIGAANDDCLVVRLWTSAGTDWNSVTNSLGIQTATIDFWGVQVEAGSTATPFTTHTGSIQGELAACRRYFLRQSLIANEPIYGGARTGSGGASDMQLAGVHPQGGNYRTAPSISFKAVGDLSINDDNTLKAVTSLVPYVIGQYSCRYWPNISPNTLTANKFVLLEPNVNTYVDYSAEL